jgi:hypothetical protein
MGHTRPTKPNHGRPALRQGFFSRGRSAGFVVLSRVAVRSLSDTSARRWGAEGHAGIRSAQLLHHDPLALKLVQIKLVRCSALLTPHRTPRPHRGFPPCVATGRRASGASSARQASRGLSFLLERDGIIHLGTKRRSSPGQRPGAYAYARSTWPPAQAGAWVGAYTS